MCKADQHAFATFDLDFASPLIVELRRHSGIAESRISPTASRSHGLALGEVPLHARA
ncbi:MAG: hypothetical protein R3F21_21180 [Myxococcota bacterium]